MNDLDNIKVGDKVIWENSMATHREIATVVGITPTGRIKIDKSNKYFRKSGCEITSDIWHSSRIYLYTEELAEEIKRKRIVNKAFSLMRNAREITYEQAEKIIDILEGVGE